MVSDLFVVLRARVWYNTRLHPGCPWGYDQSRHVFPRVFAFEPQQNTNAVLHELAAQLPL